MKRVIVAGLVIFVIGSLLAARNDANQKSAGQNKIRLNGHIFTLPPGFTIELAAGPPLVDRPITADFDEHGRLYVSDSSGSNERVEIQLKKKPHRIVRLEDSYHDGHFDRRTVFADKMMFPEGTLWYNGSLYVAAPPSIWKLTDTDGDGVADVRREWFQGKTLTGCANDLHGPYLGRDGWIYWGKGAFAQQTYERPGKKPLVTRAAHIIRCRPDGTGAEPVMTGGMDNPVDVVFTPGGERIFTTTFLQYPGGGKRDGLIHAIYGGINGKDYRAVLDTHPWTGPTLMPVLAHLGAAAPCGLTLYESKVFGPEYQGNLFACLFNMHKVTRHVLTQDGATFKSRDEDFLVSDSLDFHPTDVIEDADGSLLVVDTGGWYRLCCPTSQLTKPDILGGIYRIRRTGVPGIADPRGSTIDWNNMSAAKLAKLLDDQRPAVKKRAIEALAKPARENMAVLAKVVATSKSVETRRNAVWSLTRHADPGASGPVIEALHDADESVRQAALHSIAVRRDGRAVRELVRLLREGSAHNRRAAAEALGRIGDTSAVGALLEALGRPAGRVLEHSLIFALIEIADRAGTSAGLESPNILTRRASMIALDQMPGGQLDPELVARTLSSKHASMMEAAWWIAGRHAEWGKVLAGYFRDRLKTHGLQPSEREELARQLARLARSDVIQQLLADRLIDAAATPDESKMVLHAMAQAGLKTAPQSWVAGLYRILTVSNADLVREGVNTARAVRPVKKGSEKLAAVLLQIGRNTTTPAPVRLTALAAIPEGITTVEPALFAFVCAHLQREQAPAIRSLAADILARARLDREQLMELAELLKATGPMEVERLLDAFDQTKDVKVGAKLLEVLRSDAVRNSLRLDTLKPRLARFGTALQKPAEQLCALLNVDADKQRAKLEQLLPLVKKGDLRRGQLVFNSSRAACSACHAIGYLGGNVGPDLTHIGKIRSERDLLESIVFPSASLVRSYEPITVITHSGKVHNGLIRRESPEEMVLAVGVNMEVRIPREDIDEVQPSRVSIMPPGLDQQLTPQELADLVAFLMACK
jgi:putative membrane-bound dehydrogenase-like protein